MKEYTLDRKNCREGKLSQNKWEIIKLPLLLLLFIPQTNIERIVPHIQLDSIIGAEKIWPSPLFFFPFVGNASYDAIAHDFKCV